MRLELSMHTMLSGGDVNKRCIVQSPRVRAVPLPPAGDCLADQNDAKGPFEAPTVIIYSTVQYVHFVSAVELRRAYGQYQPARSTADPVGTIGGSTVR
jgi:hypothetical protein